MVGTHRIPGRTLLLASVVALVAGLLSLSVGAQRVEAAGECLAEVDTLELRNGFFEGVYGGYLWSNSYTADDQGTQTWDVYSPDGSFLRNVPFAASVTDPNGDVWGQSYVAPAGMAKANADGSGIRKLDTTALYISTFGGGRAWAHDNEGLVVLDMDGAEVAKIPDVDPVQTVIGNRTNSALSPVDVEGGRAFVLHKSTRWISVYDLDGNKISDVPKPPSNPSATAFTFEANAAGLFIVAGGTLHHYSHSLAWTSEVPDVEQQSFQEIGPDGIGRLADFGDGVGGVLNLGSGRWPFFFAGNGSAPVTASTALDAATTIWRVGNYMHVEDRGSVKSYDRDMALATTTTGVVGRMQYDYNMVAATESDVVVNSWVLNSGAKIVALGPDGRLLGETPGLPNYGPSYRSSDRVYYANARFTIPRLTVYDVSGCGWNGTFSDDDSSVFESDIEWMAAEGITKGCNPPSNDRFCPESDVTRGQMAAFLRRAFDLPSSSTDFFTDDDDSVFESDINALAASGITKGCNPPASDRFCPDGRVTREQMAAFMKRAFDYPPSATDFFVDDDESIFEPDINSIAEVGVTRGCNPSEGNTRYCPRGYVTRGQMAAFLHRAMG